jgi:hypothetical protein
MPFDNLSETEKLDLLDEESHIGNGGWEAEKVKVLILRERLQDTRIAVDKIDKKLDQSIIDTRTAVDKIDKKLDQSIMDLKEGIIEGHARTEMAFEKYSALTNVNVKELVESFKNCQNNCMFKLTDHEIRIQGVGFKQKILIGIGSATMLAVLSGVIKYFFN